MVKQVLFRLAPLGLALLALPMFAQELMLSPGTEIKVRADGPVVAKEGDVGKTFPATVSDPVRDSSGNIAMYAYRFAATWFHVGTNPETGKMNTTYAPHPATSAGARRRYQTLNAVTTPTHSADAITADWRSEVSPHSG